ncbi:Membrane metallo-endopeptidase-like 1 [Phytophthora citrophthora]|uniref:Membrane metallo-endopeptidase-like 1 n=1 Tax=Phytophthora citrophthora TaxID=4793 RepID=A0AAD9LE88_9STRA|nr:Membrane metallo-endopeptidase-like 1 [Phytophthora citrophthora]
MKLFSIVGCGLLLSPLLVVSRALPDKVASLMDTSIDPCDDFYRFSCGNWLDTQGINADTGAVQYSFDTAQDAMDSLLIQAIANDSASLPGALFQSCMDMDARNALGAEPLQSGLQSIVSTRSKEELFKVAGRLARTGADFITNVNPDSSLQNSSQNILWVSQADLTLDDEYYENPQVLAFVEKNLSVYASTILNLSAFELDGSEYSNYGDVVLDVEKQLIELQMYAQLDPVSADSYYLFAYKEAAANYPLVFGAYAEGMQLLDDAPALTEDSDVALLSLAYFEKAEELVSLVSLDALKVYVAFAYVNNFAKFLSQPFLDAHIEFFRGVILGAEVSQSMEKMCVYNVVDLLPAHAGAAYVDHLDDVKQTGEAFVTMLEEIIQAMIDNIKTLDWLDDMTRTSALAKLATLDAMYLEPDHEQLEKEAEGLAKLDPTAFFANVDLIYTSQYVALTWAIGADVDRDEWGMSAASINAYYSPYNNQIVFPIGIMQSPFFDPHTSTAQMFGALGVVVGHEITHGFDNSGSNFDANGNWNAWWTSLTATEFELRAQCMIDQYSSFYTEAEDEEDLIPVDGKMTLGENIADNGGLHMAFNAYRNRESSSDDDQLFFLSYAQTWCGKQRDEFAVDSYITNVHATGEARVNGAAMNSKAFATAFNCPSDSPMNPSDKCILW